jgi:hypothetical protein
MKDFEQPWHAMPSNVIELGLDYSKKESDFDHQIAFLLLDVGVEAALKSFLSYSGDTNLEYVKFPELCKKVEADLQKREQEGIDFKKVVYYHGIRNKQYHQGDGVVATRESLDGYGKLARNILNVLAGIEIGELTPIQIAKKQEELTERIRKNIKSMRSNSSILVEALFPSLARRTLDAQIAGVKIGQPIVEVDRNVFQVDPFQNQRFEQFLGLIGEQSFNDDLDEDTVDLFVQFPETFLIWVAFWELSEDLSDDWMRFIKMWSAIEPEAEIYSLWERGKVDEEVLEWSKKKADMIYKWVHNRFSDLITDEPDFRIEEI